MLPKTSALTLTTSSLDEFLPGLIATYGEDLPMAIQISSHSNPQSILLPGEMGANIGLDMTFIVEGQGTAVRFNFVDVISMLQLTLVDFRFYPIIESVKIGDAYASESQIGEIDITGLKKTFNMFMKILVPLVNVFLGSGIPFPQELFEGKLVIKDATFNSFQDYVKIALSPEFHF